MATTNTSLIRRICDPEHSDAWWDFVNTYQSMVRSYIAGRSRGRGVRLGEHDLDEVVQLVWIKLWKYSADFDFDKKRGRFRTFLYAVTVNALTDFVRRRRKHKAADVDVEQLDVNDHRLQPDDDWDLAYRAAIWTRIAGPLKAELERDSPAKWQSFEQHKLAGRPAKDVANELGIAVALVYQNTTRVMQEARKRCQAVCEEELAQ